MPPVSQSLTELFLKLPEKKPLLEWLVAVPTLLTWPR